MILGHCAKCGRSAGLDIHDGGSKLGPFRVVCDCGNSEGLPSRPTVAEAVAEFKAATASADAATKALYDHCEEQLVCGRTRQAMSVYGRFCAEVESGEPSMVRKAKNMLACYVREQMRTRDEFMDAHTACVVESLAGRLPRHLCHLGGPFRDIKWGV